MKIERTLTDALLEYGCLLGQGGVSKAGAGRVRLVADGVSHALGHGGLEAGGSRVAHPDLGNVGLGKVGRVAGGLDVVGAHVERVGQVLDLGGRRGSAGADGAGPEVGF